MKITCLSSSRADYGILSPLLKQIAKSSYFSLDIIAFGTHNSKEHGYTVEEIINDKYYENIYKLDTIPEFDTPKSIIESISKCVNVFGTFFENYRTDLVICLGDRYEMFAACSGIFPYGIKIAHISGGEETFGSTDNFYRHAITLMACYHFASTKIYQNRIINIIGTKKNVFNVGALNIDNLSKIRFLTRVKFKEKYGFEIKKKSILITFHPETVNFKNNLHHVTELINALSELNEYQLIITMPNADINGSMIRSHLEKFVNINKNAIAVNSLGMLGYLSCMKHCSMMLGNSSSGFVEASFFSKYVINLGKRQDGRILTSNIKSCQIFKDDILNAVKLYDPKNNRNKYNIYGKGNSAKNILEILKKIV
jgi:GDP/UDP-N,N'-diacetylbacillosamine 2-epimerase (hydrolysing)